MGDPGDENDSTTTEPHFVRTGELDDHAILPRRFELLAGEVRALAESINRKVVPALERIVERLDEDNTDINRHGRAISRHEGEIAALRDRVDEAHVEILALVGAR
jgi:hypothetical protein